MVFLNTLEQWWATCLSSRATLKKIRFRLDPDVLSHQKSTLLNSRGGSTTRPSSFLISRPTKVCTWPSDSLAPYWHGLNNRSFEYTTDKSSSEHLDTSHHVAILSLKQFSHRPPRHQFP
ncbi:hypothetical protein TNCV_4639111 [Trichonephila clavipes]|nr:hypothetical protein TNCV_4639111 [Trichonephila clavipes]